MMKSYEIWSEGFHVMEGRSPAHFHGIAEGHDFKEACKNFAILDSEFARYFDEERMTHWGCRLFDNETEARQAFG